MGVESFKLAVSHAVRPRIMSNTVGTAYHSYMHAAQNVNTLFLIASSWSTKDKAN